MIIGKQERWWELSGTPKLDEGGHYIGFRGVGSDVTEQRESSEKIAWLARYDTLTQLPNRLHLTEALGDDKESTGELILHHLDTGHIASEHIGGDHGRHQHHHDDAPSVAEAGQRTAVIEPGPYGVGSAAPRPDNSAPPGFTIKGNVDSMLYHRPDSRSYSVTRAEVWFDSAERAEAAGFSLANTHPSPES